MGLSRPACVRRSRMPSATLLSLPPRGAHIGQNAVTVPCWELCPMWPWGGQHGQPRPFLTPDMGWGGSLSLLIWGGGLSSPSIISCLVEGRFCSQGAMEGVGLLVSHSSPSRFCQGCRGSRDTIYPVCGSLVGYISVHVGGPSGWA